MTALTQASLELLVFAKASREPYTATRRFPRESVQIGSGRALLKIPKSSRAEPEKLPKTSSRVSQGAGNFRIRKPSEAQENLFRDFLCPKTSSFREN